jgi:TPR repeat protein
MSTKKESIWFLVFMFIFNAGYTQTDVARRAGRAKADTITLSLSTTNISFDASGGTAVITIFSNAMSWDISDNPAWCPASKSGNKLTIIAQRNTTNNERSGYLSVNAGKKQVQVNLRQHTEDTYATGLRCYEQKKYVDALRWFYKSADQGNAAAQYYLGVMYQNGYGVTKDYGAAVKRYHKSAEQGDVLGQNSLGYMYQYGYGVEQNYEEAIKWYRKSADQGNMDARKALSRVMQLTGYVEEEQQPQQSQQPKQPQQSQQPKPQQPQKEEGDPYDIGGRYFAEKNYTEAAKWYRKSAEAGNPKGQNNLGYMYRNGYGVEQDNREAVGWYRKSAEQGYASGQYNIGYMYEKGYGVEQSYAEAGKWYRKSAEQGDEDAGKALTRILQMTGNTEEETDPYAAGRTYYNEKNYVEAVKCFRKSAGQGNAFGQNWLGYMYHHGHGVEKNYEEAIKWYRKSADQGNASAQNSLGYMYQYGYGVERNYAEAVKLYRKSANQGNASGQYNLGYMYENGHDVAKDDEEAVKWYRKSADQGNKNAQKALSRIITGNVN